MNIKNKGPSTNPRETQERIFRGSKYFLQFFKEIPMFFANKR